MCPILFWPWGSRLRQSSGLGSLYSVGETDQNKSPRKIKSNVDRQQKEARWEGEIGVRKGKGPGEPPPSDLIQERSKVDANTHSVIDVGQVQHTARNQLTRQGSQPSSPASRYSGAPLLQSFCAHYSLFQTIPWMGP